MIHSRVLHYLDEVARCGSIRKAAVVLNVAASAINRQIIALEKRLGSPLFERLPGHMRPTAAGEVLIAHARDMLKQERRALDRVVALKDPRVATASIATVGGLAGDILSHALAEYRPRLYSREIPVPELERADFEIGIGRIEGPLASITPTLGDASQLDDE